MADEKREIRVLDPYSETWGLVRDLCASALQELRKGLDAPGNLPTAYDVMRGEIRAYENVLLLGMPKAKPDLILPLSDPAGL